MALQYQIHKETLPQLYALYGVDYEEVFVMLARQVISDVLQHFSPGEGGAGRAGILMHTHIGLSLSLHRGKSMMMMMIWQHSAILDYEAADCPKHVHDPEPDAVA